MQNISRVAGSSPPHLLMFCIRSSHCHQEREPVSRTTVAEDRFIGALAIAARCGVALWRVETLANDGQMRVVDQFGAYPQWIVHYQ